MTKRKYNKPEVLKIDLDYSISLQMQSGAQPPDPIRGGGSKSQPSEPFSSPFEQKPFG